MVFVGFFLLGEREYVLGFFLFDRLVRGVVGVQVVVSVGMYLGLAWLVWFNYFYFELVKNWKFFNFFLVGFMDNLNVEK